jgi:hypothetical protein
LNHYSNPFVLIIFEIEPCFMPGPVWTTILLFVLPHEAQETGACHCTQPLVEMGSHKLPLVPAGLKLWSSQSLPPKYLGLQAWATLPAWLIVFWFYFF